MDPDAILAEIRTFVAKWEGSAREQRPIAEYDRAIEKIRDLDALLTRGGRLPVAWAVQQVRPLRPLS
jgi:hypothetical protein